MKHKFRANGKLLIAGEYAVLDGALAFAVPTKVGQTLEVEYSVSIGNPKLNWEAYLMDGSLWFSAEFDLKTLEIIKTSNAKFSSKLWDIFQVIEKLNSNFFHQQSQNIYCKTQLEFPKDWGLGSSSTLIYLLGKWANIDPFELNKLTFKTSGYDVACAGIDTPIFYQQSNGERKIKEVKFRPDFINQLYFIYLNQKQDTQISVSQNYTELPKDPEWIESISQICYNMANSKTLYEFEKWMNLHEELIASKLKFPKVKELLFPDYTGSVKSLGAWGGDFILATGREGFQDYFKSKGFTTILSFSDLLIR